MFGHTLDFPDYVAKPVLVSAHCICEHYGKQARHPHTHTCHERQCARVLSQSLILDILIKYCSCTGPGRRGSSVKFDVAHILGRRKWSVCPLRPGSYNPAQMLISPTSSFDVGFDPDPGNKCASATRHLQMRERTVRGVVSPYFLDPRRKFGLHLE